MKDDILQIREFKGIQVAKVTAEKIYQNAVPRLKSQMDELLKTRPPKVLVDLSHVTVMNSSGLGVLIAAQDEMNRHRGTLILTGLSPMMRQLFEQMRLSELFQVTEDEAEALGRF